jgi:phosphohistidine phosphatase
MLYLVHHGDAADPAVEAQRPLTPEGRAGVTSLAARAVERGVRPAIIWHSGKLRARQTAEIMWKACNPLAAISAQRALQPSDPPEWLADLIMAEVLATPAPADLMVVGHLPHLPRLRAHLLQLPLPIFPQHGMVAFDWDGRAWIEQWELRST